MDIPNSLNNMEHIKKIVSKEMNDNLKSKNSNIIMKDYFSNLCLIHEFTRHSIDMLSNPSEYIKYKKLGNPDEINI
jgi:hypothetical protein